MRTNTGICAAVLTSLPFFGLLSKNAEKPLTFFREHINRILLPSDIKSRMSRHVETVVLLSKLKSTHHIEVELKTDELDLTSAESKATYDEIKAYVKKHTGLTVSSLNIAQVKQKCGIIERENYNKAKSKDSRQPRCPKEKEDAIVEALKFFKMI